MILRNVALLTEVNYRVFIEVLSYFSFQKYLFEFGCVAVAWRLFLVVGWGMCFERNILIRFPMVTQLHIYGT